MIKTFQIFQKWDIYLYDATVLLISLMVEIPFSNENCDFKAS